MSTKSKHDRTFLFNELLSKKKEIIKKKVKLLFDKSKSIPGVVFDKAPKKTIMQEIIDAYPFKNHKEINLEKAYQFRYSNDTNVPYFPIKNGSQYLSKKKKGSRKTALKFENFLKMFEDEDKSKVISKDAFNQPFKAKTPSPLYQTQ